MLARNSHDDKPVPANQSGPMEDQRDFLTAKVLLIEDDEDDYVLIRDILLEIPHRDYILNWASTYEQGLEAIETNAHDVCLLDYRLGLYSGLDILKVAGERGHRMPIIFLTGQGDYEVDVVAMKSGAQDYLVKENITPALLERSIRYAIEGARIRKSLQEARDMLEIRVRERTAALAQANKELERINEKIRFFAYSVSHDLKSPAFGIHSLAKLFLDRYEVLDDRKRKEYCTHILRASEQISCMAEKINLFISAKEASLDLEQIEMGEILSLLKSEFSTPFRTRNLRWSIPRSLPAIRADRVSVVRILRNLIDNALKYGGENLNEVRIGFRESEDYYILSVSDDGVGLNGKDPERLFNSFYRGSNTANIEGAGLGLAIIKEIAEKHKGNAWFEPLPLKGVNCFVSLPKRW
jgi:signal transduction histidine kinase